MSTQPVVLVLDGHTIQALACVRSLGRSGYRVVVASHRRRPLAAWSRYCQHHWRVSAQSVSAFADLRSWATAYGVDVVLPLTERSCFLCNLERDAWHAQGMVLGCGPNDMLVQAFDKAQTLRCAQQCGINIPPTRFPTTMDEFHEAARELGLPCVVKARFSNAWTGEGFSVDPGVAYVNRFQDLAPAVLGRKQGAHNPIIQRFVTGRGKGIFTVCDRGEPVSWFAHERLRDIRPSGSGSSLRHSVPLEPVLREGSELLLRALSWHGPAMLEFLDDGDNVPWLMEVNGRFWGSLHLAVEAGADFPVHWVRLLTGERVSPSDHYRHGVTRRWLWGDIKRLLYIVKGAPSGYPNPYPRIRQGITELLGHQPPGTRLDTWDPNDPWPAAAEWMQGVSELLELRFSNGPSR